MRKPLKLSRCLKGMPSKIDETLNRIAALSDKASEALEVLKKNEDEIKKTERLLTLSNTASVLAHEIRNPLGYIKLAASFLERKIDNEELKKFLSIINAGVQNIEHCIQNILSFSSKKTLNRKYVQLRELILQVATEMATLFPTVKINFNIDGFLYAFLDIDAIKRVLINILKNALIAPRDTDKDPEVMIVGRSLDDSVEVQVLDNGVGFPEGFTASMIEPFRSYFKGGTGLGLAISKELIEAHGGSLELGNMLDTNGKPIGAKVCLRIPRSNV